MALRHRAEASILATAMTDQRTIFLLLLFFIGIPTAPAQEKKTADPKVEEVANALFDRGKYAEAAKVYRALIIANERALGAEHPATLANRCALAFALKYQGKYADEETEHHAVLTIRERVLGAEHSDTLSSCYCLTICLEN